MKLLTEKHKTVSLDVGQVSSLTMSCILLSASVAQYANCAGYNETMNREIMHKTEFYNVGFVLFMPDRLQYS